MKTMTFTPLFLAVTVLLGACSSVPKSTALLEQTRNDYQAAQSNPNVATHAPLAMRQASEAMALANIQANERDSDANIDKLAYLAKQKIALAQELALQKMAEADVANSGKARDQMRLDQRTNEANAANLNAQQSKQATLQAQDDAARAQQQTLLAQDDAAMAQRVALDAQMRTVQLEAQLADLAAKKTDRGMVITLGDVLFGTDLARLTSDGLATAQKLANVLKANPQRNVLIEGFADRTGSTAHNLALSERRAKAVQTTLQDMGVAPNRVSVQGYGESFPVAANDTADHRQLNRRVEIVLSDDMGKVIAR